MDDRTQTMWTFEPHVAERVFDAWVEELDLPIWRDAWLDRGRGVKIESGSIRSITLLDGRTIAGRMFVDATYEGDLMAAAGVSHHVGREANSVYGETWNGVQVGVLHHDHHFGKRKISPYLIPGDPSSGLLPRISAEPPGERGHGDHRVQAYCFRMCLTDHSGNRVPFPDRRATTRASTPCSRGCCTTEAATGSSGGSIRFPTVRPTRTTKVRSAPTTSA